MFRLKLIKKPILLKLKTNFSFPPIVLANMQEKETIPTKEKQEIVPDKNYDGLSKVIVDKIPDEYIIPTGNIEITKNGIYNVREKETANVNIPVLKLGTKNITENGVYKASDDELDGYSEVTVGIKKLFTGSYDRQGLKQIGWTDEEIDYYNQNGVQWNASENEYFKLTTEELAGDTSTNTRFLPKNNGRTSFQNYHRLLAIATLDNITQNTISELFQRCSSLTTIPYCDTSNITNMNYTFSGCRSLESIPQLNTSKVKSMSQTFRYCNSLVTIPLLDTSSVTDMQDMFDSCSSLKTIPLLDTSKVNNFGEIFSNCFSLKSLPLLDTSSATKMSYSFNNCYSLLTIPRFNTSNVTDMSAMFKGCGALLEIPLLDTSSVTNMNSMFSACSSLKTIPLLDTSKVYNFGSMFSSCINLESLPLLDFSSATYISGVFSGCNLLTTVEGFLNLGKSYLTTQSANYYSYKLELQTSPKLTETSIINILNNLYDIKTAGCKTQQVVLGRNNLAKLTSEEGQQALSNSQAKGWSIS